MGLSPRQVDDTSLWQFAAANDGYAEAHDPPDGAMSEDEIAAAEAALDAAPDVTM